MLENKRYAEAIPRLQTAYEKDPTQANRLALALAYLETRDLDKALPLIEKGVAADPGNFDVRMMYGRALRDTRQFSAAAHQFSEALKLKPGDAKAWSDLGGMLYMSGNQQQALAAFERARELGEDTPGNWFFRAIILDKLKQVKPALEAYQRFLSMSQGKNPDQEFQARQRARILQRELEKR
jgi:Tfp pilus assembly protein PilF